MNLVVRLVAALVLVIVAASSPIMGFAASESYSGRKFYGVFEGDWLFWFALIAGAASAWAAAALLRDRHVDRVPDRLLPRRPRTPGTE